MIHSRRDIQYCEELFKSFYNIGATADGGVTPVSYTHLMKDNKTSERNILKLSENITLLPGLEKEKFSAYLTEEERRERKIFYADQFERMTKQAEGYDVLFMDEIIYAIQAELLEEDKIIEYLKRKPKHLEIILTGNRPSMELLDMADYATEMKKIKHPFDKGIKARMGIER